MEVAVVEEEAGVGGWEVAGAVAVALPGAVEGATSTVTGWGAGGVSVFGSGGEFGLQGTGTGCGGRGGNNWGCTLCSYTGPTTGRMGGRTLIL